MHTPSIPTTNTAASSQLTHTLLHPQITLPTSIPQLDKVQDGFTAGELIFIDGTSPLISTIPAQLCVYTYQNFHSDTLYIDGGMRVNPYTIASAARRHHLNQHQLLTHVHISRAFTVYQLSTLIQDMLEPMIQQCNPLTLIIGMYPALYLDPDVDINEAQLLCKTNLNKLIYLTKTYQLITLLTHHSTTSLLHHHQHLHFLLNQHADEIISITNHDSYTTIKLLNKQATTRFPTGTPAQLQLDDFTEVNR